MSQGKLRDLPHLLTLPKLLGSAGNWNPPGVGHELKGVKRSQGAVERETTNPQPLQSFRAGGGSPGGGWASLLYLAFQLWAILSLQLPSWCCC